MVAAAQKKTNLVLVETEHAAAETKSSEKSAPSFLEEVAQMATLAEEAIRKLRTETHGDSFQFKDLNLDYLFPQKVNSVEYMVQLETVVNQYLNQTMPYGLNRSNFRAGSPIEENTATYAHTAEAWRSQLYTDRKSEIDKMVDESFQRIIYSADHEIADMVFRLGQSSKDSESFYRRVGRLKLTSPEQLEGEKRAIKTALYQTELLKPEALNILYTLCFKMVIKQRGWEELDDKKLAEALVREKEPLEKKLEVRQRTEELEHAIRADMIRNLFIRALCNAAACADLNNEQPPTIHSKYIIVGGDSYFDGLKKLNAQDLALKNHRQPVVKIKNKDYIRPFTAKEMLQEKVEDFCREKASDGALRTMNERSILWYYTWMDTCSAVLLKQERDIPQPVDKKYKIKIIPRCDDLIEGLSSKIDYSRTDGIEITVSDGMSGRFNKPNVFLEHPFWLAIAEEDSCLLREVAEINLCLGHFNCELAAQRGLIYWYFNRLKRDTPFSITLPSINSTETSYFGMLLDSKVKFLVRIGENG